MINDDSIENISIKDFVSKRNREKVLFTAGPASLISENITGLRPCFGRGDKDYESLENSVLEQIKKICGQKEIIRLQGSASLALEIACSNYLYGKVLIISSGYYSDRLKKLVYFAKDNQGEIDSVEHLDWTQISSDIDGNYDWVVSCYTETSNGIKIPIEELSSLAKRVKAKLLLDATASIGLEEGHHEADVLAFSSCKGLFGLTGAAFLAFKIKPSINVKSFYLSFDTHLNKKITGPYHSICSLKDVLEKYNQLRDAVIENKNRFLKEYDAYLNLPLKYQPNLCTLC